MKYESSFSPIQIGDLEIKNRIFAAVTESRITVTYGSGEPLKMMLNLEKAKGGFGLVSMGGCDLYSTELKLQKGLITKDSEYKNSIHYYIKEYINKMHDTGAKIAMQLYDAQWQTLVGESKNILMASDIPGFFGEKTKKITLDQIDFLVDFEINFAKYIQQLGIDVVELPVCYDGLFKSFITPKYNNRDDEYNGSLENRCLLIKRIIQGIKDSCGKEYPIIIKLTIDDRLDDGIRFEESVEIAKLLESYGADAFSINTGTHLTADYMLYPTGTKSNILEDYAEKMKAEIHVPIILSNRVNNPMKIEEAIQTGKCDAVSLGRQSVADPYFPYKMLVGNEGEIITCIGCSSRCMSMPKIFKEQEEDYGTACMFNPLCNNNKRLKNDSTLKVKKKIGIIGAGVAGLQSALLLSKKGYQVTVFEKEGVVGGEFRIASKVPGESERVINIDRLYHLCLENRVDFKLNKNIENVKQINNNFDDIIIATGAQPYIPRFLKIENTPYYLARDVLNEQIKTEGNVLIVGGGLVGIETALYCSKWANKVTIIEKNISILNEVYISNQLHYSKLLKDNKIHLILGSEVKYIKNNECCYLKEGQENKISLDTAIIAMGYHSQTIEGDLTRSKIHIIGDAYQPRNAYTAIYDAYKLCKDL